MGELGPWPLPLVVLFVAIGVILAIHRMSTPRGVWVAYGIGLAVLLLLPLTQLSPRPPILLRMTYEQAKVYETGVVAFALLSVVAVPIALFATWKHAYRLAAAICIVELIGVGWLSTTQWTYSMPGLSGL